MLEAVRTECDRLVREVVVDFPPSLVHGDLHPRNVVVDRAEPSGALRLAALLDFEHARFLDPAWDFVKLDLWVFAPHPDLEAPFRAAYRAARGESESFRSRVRLCGGLEILRALPYFGAEFPDEAMFDSFFTALERWLAG